MSEQRIQTRQRVLKAGTISFDGAGIHCVVCNISADGAALEVESQTGIPSEFNLVITTEQFSEFCHVLWRKAKRLGVVFQSQASADCAAPLAPVFPPCESDIPTNPSTDPAAACIRSEDTLPEHPGPSIAPDLPD